MLNLVCVNLNGGWNIWKELKLVFQVLSFAVILSHFIKFIKALFDVNVFMGRSKLIFIDIVYLLKVFHSELDFLYFAFTFINEFCSLPRNKLLQFIHFLVCSSGVLI